MVETIEALTVMELLAIDARHAIDRLIPVDELALDSCYACPSKDPEQLLNYM